MKCIRCTKDVTETGLCSECVWWWNKTEEKKDEYIECDVCFHIYGQDDVEDCEMCVKKHCEPCRREKCVRVSNPVNYKERDEMFKEGTYSAFKKIVRNDRK